VIVDRVPVMVAGGVESVSLVQNEHFNNHRIHEPWIDERKPELYLPMIDTAEVVARRYDVTREAQDEYALASQQRTAAGQQAGRFDAEIVPITVIKLTQDKSTGEMREEQVTLTRDEGNRPDTSVEGLAKLAPVRGEKGHITAGNASQLSDGASACVVMDATLAARRGVKPLGIFRGFAVAGCEPDEMGIGPVFAVPKLLARTGKKIDDIGLWELNEAFAAQSLAVVKELGVPEDKVNVNGGAIALGHPIGASGARVLVTLLHEMQKRDAKRGLASLCIGGGMGVALAVERS